MDRELVDYLPQVLQGVRELRGIVDAEQPELRELWTSLAIALEDQFISDASTNGLGRLESILKIVPKGTETEEERRFRIFTRFNEQLPYSYRVLEKQLRTLCGQNGYTVALNHDDYTLMVRIKLFAESNYSDVENLLTRIVPANMVIDLSLLFNKHRELASYSHNQLSRYTHLELKRTDFAELAKQTNDELRMVKQ